MREDAWFGTILWTHQHTTPFLQVMGPATGGAGVQGSVASGEWCMAAMMLTGRKACFAVHPGVLPEALDDRERETL